MRLEVVDKMCVSAMRVAVIKEVIGGRLRLVYQDSEVCLAMCFHLKATKSHNFYNKISLTPEYHVCLAGLTAMSVINR